MASSWTSHVSDTNDLDEELVCPMCLDMLKDPVSLPCQHWSCRDCLKEWVQNNNNVLICPECQGTFPLPNGGVAFMPGNFKAKQMCERFLARQTSRNNSKVAKCEKHPIESLSHVCCDCMQFICEECTDSGELHYGHSTRIAWSSWSKIGGRFEQILKVAKEDMRKVDTDVVALKLRQNSLQDNKCKLGETIHNTMANILQQINETKVNLDSELDNVFEQIRHKERMYLEDRIASQGTITGILEHAEGLKELMKSRRPRELLVSEVQAFQGLQHCAVDASKVAPIVAEYQFQKSKFLESFLSDGFGRICTTNDGPMESGTFKTYDAPEQDDIYKPSGTLPSGRIGAESNFHLMSGISKPKGALLSERIDGKSNAPLDILEVIAPLRRIPLPPRVIGAVDVEESSNGIHLFVSDKIGNIFSVPTDPSLGQVQYIRKQHDNPDPKLFMKCGPCGITHSFEGKLYACNSSRECVDEIDLDTGIPIGSYGESKLFYPISVAFSDQTRTLSVLDMGGGVKTFDKTSRKLISIIGQSSFIFPRCVCTDNNNRIYVTDALQGQILLFDNRKTNEIVTRYDVKLENQPVECYGISVGSNGHILVSANSKSVNCYGKQSLLLEYKGNGDFKRVGGRDMLCPRGLRLIKRSKVAIVADMSDNCILFYSL